MPKINNIKTVMDMDSNDILLEQQSPSVWKYTDFFKVSNPIKVIND